MITLYRFPYSCYALKVQYLLQRLELPHQVKDVPFCDRAELVEITGGRVTVPAIDHDGKVVVESRDICRYLLGLTENTLVPSGLEAAVWAYADWSDTELEDVLFRVASPRIAERFALPTEKALFIFVKERKFGTGCVEQWQREKEDLIARAKTLLEPTLTSIRKNGYLFGAEPTLADFSLLGHLAMVEYADPALLAQIDEALLPFMNTLR